MCELSTVSTTDAATYLHRPVAADPGSTHRLDGAEGGSVAGHGRLHGPGRAGQVCRPRGSRLLIGPVGRSVDPVPRSRCRCRPQARPAMCRRPSQHGCGQEPTDYRDGRLTVAPPAFPGGRPGRPRALQARRRRRPRRCTGSASGAGGGSRRFMTGQARRVYPWYRAHADAVRVPERPDHGCSITVAKSSVH